VDSGGAAQLWDSASGRPLEHWQVGVATEKLGWDRFAINARFWPGDRLFLASLPFEGKKLWDAANGTPLVFLADNEAVLPMNGGRTLAVVDDWGTVRTEHIPDSDSALTRESYAQYQREWAARTALTIEAKPPKTRMFISSEDLALALSDLARVGAETAGPQGVSLAVADSTRTQSMAAAGLGAGDGVTALNGTVFTGADAARAALATAAQQLAGNPRGTVSATLSRGGQAWECIYWALPLQRDERPVTVTREDAVGLVQWQLDTLATDKEVNPKAAWLGVSSCPYRDIADRMKLPGEVAMIAIDGTPFDSMGAVEQALNLFRQRIADGSLTTFSQTFREGVYREHTRTFTVSQ
jgi:hypothetical protein